MTVVECPCERLKIHEAVNQRNQVIPSLNVLLWDIDSFKLKALEKQQKEEGLSALTFSTEKQT